jgi:hypothetical protein
MEELDRRLSHRTALIVAIAVTAGVLLLAGSVALGMIRPDAWGRSGPDDSTNLDYSRKSTPLGRLSDEYVESQSQGDASGAGSSSAKGSRSGGSLPADTTSQDPEIAGPPVYYTDRADDAHGSGMPPNAALSQKAFDILRVDWAPLSHGYSTSITVAGTATEDGSYVSYGYFFPRGEACRIYYILTPGLTAYAHAFCESSGDEWGFVGVVEGSEVTSTPTTAGGTQVVATFDSRAVPPLLETAGRKLHNLSAFTCEEIDDRYAGDSRSGLYCGNYGVLDTASSALTYRV